MSEGAHGSGGGGGGAPTRVKLTIPQSKLPLSCTVTPGSSRSLSLNIPARNCTCFQMLSIPMSRMYSKAMPSPSCSALLQSRADNHAAF